MQIILIMPILCFGIWDADTHDVNNWILTITNYGRFGDISNYWLPESIPVRCGGLWFGTISPQSETLVTIGCGYNANFEFGPGLKIQDPNSFLARIYMHPIDWPPDPDTYPMAPQVPLTCQESWSCYNDFDSTSHMSDGKPIGIEIYQTTFADTSSIIKDVLFLKYEIKNCTTYTINNAIISIVWEVDCQEPDAYYNGLILNKRFYPSPQDSFLVEDLGWFYGDTLHYYCDTFAVGVLFIKTPNNLGCTAYKLFTPTIGPTGDSERYLTMAGYNYRTGVYDPYDSLPGDPDDRYVLMSCGSFNLEPEEIKEFVIALIAAPYNNDTLPLAIIARNAKNFYSDSLLAIREDKQPLNLQLQIANLYIYPNPFSKLTKISFGKGHGAKGIELKIYDVSGRLVRSFDPEGLRTEGLFDYSTIRQSGYIIWNGVNNAGQKLPSGVYFVRLEVQGRNITKKIIKLK